MITSKYFTENEFRMASPQCSLQNMSQEFMDKLGRTREIAKIPFIINSAYRTEAHEKKMGRSGNSAHTEGCAADIKALDGRSKYLIVDAAIKAGFNRIGINANFIHLDNSKKLEPCVVFTY
ncbi:MAG: hypothetical protein LBI45_02150 [Bacteroidales bacterium]|jgi:uncharacterized protein YcbK (DUF882 family)|nr:hypothetical protein [Bacteroidales bacterium]